MCRTPDGTPPPPRGLTPGPSMRAFRPAILAIAAVAGIALAMGTDPVQAESTVVVAPAPPHNLWTELLRDVVRYAIPDGYVDDSDWGHTRKIFAGVEIERGRNGLPRISKEKRTVRHGLWRKYRITLRNPDETLSIEVEPRDTAGGTGFVIVIRSRIRITAHLEHWVNGVKGINFETIADATVRMRIVGQLAIHSEPVPGRLLPDLVLEPSIERVHLRLADFDLHKFGLARGDLAEELGDRSRCVVEKLLQSREKDLLKKARRTIDRHRDDLRLSLGR